MKISLPNQNIESVQGTVERVTFHSEENGFSVLRLKVKGQRDLVTLTGNLASIRAGEFVTAQGMWFNDKNYGLQFKASELKVIPPTSREGIEKYLASGLIKGIGAFFAKRLVSHFGEAIFEVIDNTPERLRECEGIGEKRYKQIISAWHDQKMIREIMVFLQSHHVGTSRAVRIYKYYGETAIQKVNENPYRLADDIFGIGFKTADALAMSLGIEKNSPLRAAAGIHYTLRQLSEEGHVAYPEESLAEEAASLLEIEPDIIKSAIQKEIGANKLILAQIENRNHLYLPAFYAAEMNTAKILKNLMKSAPPWGEIPMEKAIPWVEMQATILLSDSQKKALEIALSHSVSIITGGPGVGKTTVVNSLIKIIRAKNISIALCAPTGRAAKRMQESTGMEAKTIHRLLEFTPQTHSFSYNENNPLPIQCLIVDEASMLDIILMYQLVKALPKTCAVIFVGDIDQLPSVGPGFVLGDLINSEQIHTARLMEIFRQGKNSSIILNAHRINAGLFLENKPDNDFYFIESEDVEEIQKKLIHIVAERIPSRYHVNPIQSVQVLTPMNRGGLGALSLNITLQARLNPNHKEGITRYGTTFAVGDKIIQIVNNYDKDVFNGDMGVIETLNKEEEILTVKIDERFVEYDFSELDELRLAYAVSIHKSQGSEYPFVVIPLCMQHYTLLARNLLYTAVTRGKKFVVVIGQKKAVTLAIKNFKQVQRITNLKALLRL